jgi:hypothetical protein
MMKELDSKQHYDEPQMMFHESVHSPRHYIQSGNNDMMYGSGSFGINQKYALPGQNDMKGGPERQVKKKRIYKKK